MSEPFALSESDTSTETPYRVEYERLPDPRWMPALFWLWLAVAIPYVVWRFYVVNWDYWLGPLLLVPELFIVLLSLMFLGTAQQIHMPVHRPTDLSRWTVDCLIPTHLEPPDVIETTVLGALRVRGVREVVVLANYERAEIRAVCERLGVRYLPRNSNLHAKAGNLNEGLRYSDAPFLLLLDADHIARPELLERMMGWFDDPRLAFAQGPQLYYNTDTFLFRGFRGVRNGWSEQTMFYQVVQPSKNRWNAALFVGSSAVLRRAALDSVGGFATGTATEDIHTSIRLHAKGWHGVYTNEPVAYGIEAHSMRELFTQRRRWAAGAAGLCLRSKDSPLRTRGLTFMQRVNYFNSTISHVGGPLRFIQIVLPLIVVVTLIPPIKVSFLGFVAMAMLYFVFSASMAYLYSRGSMHFIHNEAYTYANHPGMSWGMYGLIKVQRKFLSSRKNTGRAENHWVRWYLWILALVGLAGFGLGGYRILVQHDHSQTVLWSTFFIAVNEFWMAWFLLYLIRYEIRTRNDPPPRYQQLTGLDRYNYVLSQFDGRYVMPSGVMVDRPVRTSRVRPGRAPGTIETRAFVYEPAVNR